MRAVLPAEPGIDAPRLGDWPAPVAGAGEVVLEVRATALNRADLLQIRGRYDPPAGESRVPGLEAAGVVASVGPGVAGWRVGERAMALLAGGGQAAAVAVPAGQLLPIPDALGFVEAAAVPEAAITSWVNLVEEGGLRAGERVLLTGATSGVGTFALQVARSLGAEVLACGRDLDRLRALEPLGASVTLLFDEDLPARVRAATGGGGADLALDLVGGAGLPKVLASLAPRGRCVLVGLVAGRRAELDLGLLLTRRLRLVGSVLRSRSREEKAHLVAAFGAHGLERLADGRLAPVVAEVYPFERIADAYADLERGGRVGKLVVELPG
ncbi:MAG: zinc-binding dehydrogenase [Acidobacteria bacterium]|nr:zinc-binding dehydrogenase [Acidobacteriota bacterium]